MENILKIHPGVTHGAFRGQIRLWNPIFDSLGEKGLSHNKPTIPIEKRLELFVRVENGESYTSVARSVGIQENLLIKWHKIYRQEGIYGLKSLKRGRPVMNKKTKTKNL